MTTIFIFIYTTRSTIRMRMEAITSHDKRVDNINLQGPRIGVPILHVIPLMLPTYGPRIVRTSEVRPGLSWY